MCYLYYPETYVDFERTPLENIDAKIKEAEISYIKAQINNILSQKEKSDYYAEAVDISSEELNNYFTLYSYKREELQKAYKKYDEVHNDLIMIKKTMHDLRYRMGFQGTQNMFNKLVHREHDEDCVFCNFDSSNKICPRALLMRSILLGRIYPKYKLNIKNLEGQMRHIKDKLKAKITKRLMAIERFDRYMFLINIDIFN